MKPRGKQIRTKECGMNRWVLQQTTGLGLFNKRHPECRVAAEEPALSLPKGPSEMDRTKLPVAGLSNRERLAEKSQSAEATEACCRGPSSSQSTPLLGVDCSSSG